MKPLLVLVSLDAHHEARARSLATTMDSDLKCFRTADDLLEDTESATRASMIFLTASDVAKEQDIAARVQTVKFAAQEVPLTVIAEKKLKPDSASFIKKSGAKYVLLEDEYLETSKPEFIASQAVHGEWIPAKASEFKKDSTVPVGLYHFMPLNRKFLNFLPSGGVLDEAKYQRLLKAGEVYLKREDSLKFLEYTKSFEDLSAAGLVNRCRRQYLAMTLVYKDMVLLLTDQSEAASFQQGKELMDRVRTLSDDFITSLGAVGEAWSVVNAAGFADFTPVDRAPAIGATAGLISLLAGIGNPTEIFLAAILADVGLLELPPQELGLWKKGELDKLKPESRATYERHPIASINRILARKLPLDDKTKQIIQCTHERADGKGFPNQLPLEKIPEASLLIQLAEIMDQEMKYDWGKEKKDPASVREAVLRREMAEGKRFSYGFIDRVMKAIL